jgi:hypothetical protein
MVVVVVVVVAAARTKHKRHRRHDQVYAWWVGGMEHIHHQKNLSKHLMRVQQVVQVGARVRAARKASASDPNRRTLAHKPARPQIHQPRPLLLQALAVLATIVCVDGQWKRHSVASMRDSQRVSEVTRNATT